VEAVFRPLSEATYSAPRWRNQLRRLKRREILRIGIRDICLDTPIEEIMEELSALAEALLQVELDRMLDVSGAGESGAQFCLLAFGKLGGAELNYSSDIDLLAISGQPLAEDSEKLFKAVMDGLRKDLSGHTEEGAAYRLDLRLRPFGRSGELVSSVPRLIRYYRDQAATWELQALLKARPVAGNLRVGQAFLQQCTGLLREPRPRESVLASLQRMRESTRSKLSRGLETGRNIKLGSGGIRDVEFLVQGLQLIHAAEGGEILSGNTLAALASLRERGILKDVEAENLRRDYLFLRRIEHYLQIFEDRQTHTLPRDSRELQALSRRMLGPQGQAPQLLDRVSTCMGRVETAYRRFFGE
jgi:glutamate-ammonia-ligase adenylyltransferase